MRKVEGAIPIRIETQSDLDKLVWLNPAISTANINIVPPYINCDNTLSFLHFNANSLLRHIDLLRSLVSKNRYDRIAVSETWLHSLVADELVKLDQYSVIRNGRWVAWGGGVACYVHNPLKFRIVAISEQHVINAPEFMILELRSSISESLLFTNIYRRTKGLLFQKFCQSYRCHSFAHKNIIVFCASSNRSHCSPPPICPTYHMFSKLIQGCFCSLWMIPMYSNFIFLPCAGRSTRITSNLAW